MHRDKDEKTETGKKKSDSAGDETVNQDDVGEDVRPVITKHGERPDNLRRRSEWFQKRTGGR